MLSVVQKTFEGHPSDKVSLAAEELYAHYASADSYQVFSDFQPFVHRWSQEKGLKLAVLSNFDIRLHKILHDLNVGHYFVKIVTSEEAGASKPQADFFKHALQQIQFDGEHEEILHIGDDLVNDVQGANELGWNSAFINRTGEQMDQVMCTINCTTFNDISDVIEKRSH